MDGFVLASLGLLALWVFLVLAPPVHPWNSLAAVVKAGGFVLLIGALAGAMWCVAFLVAQVRRIAPRAVIRRGVVR